MEEAKPSQTAISTALFRAAHRLIDPRPWILDDPYAGRFAGFSSDDAVREAFERRPPAVQDSRTLFVVRSRLAEDEMERMLGQASAQYVILGAGLDSYAFRHRDRGGALKVFEVDHPASQGWKRQRLDDLGLEIPDALSFVPVDFTRDTLSSALMARGFRRDRLSFFSILGVVQYLTDAQVIRLLQDIHALSAPGSGLVLQFLPPAEKAGADADLLETLGAAAAKHGEPWVSRFYPRQMESRLKESGFGDVVHFGAEAATARYLEAGGRQPRIPSYFQMTSARVA